jgi:hypothetical protein
MDEPLDLSKKRVIPEVTYSVVENLGWDARDKKQRKIGTITQLQYIDLQTASDELKLVDQHGELLLECKMGDEYHQLLLEVGLNTILEKFIKIKEGNLGSLKELDCEGIDISAEKGKVNIVDIPGFEGTMDELDNLVNK